MERQTRVRRTVGYHIPCRSTRAAGNSVARRKQMFVCFNCFPCQKWVRERNFDRPCYTKTCSLQAGMFHNHVTCLTTAKQKFIENWNPLPTFGFLLFSFDQFFLFVSVTWGLHNSKHVLMSWFSVKWLCDQIRD